MHTRETILKQMQAWVGAVQGDPVHKKIIDTYNSHKPLARGYKVKYTDAWCATTVSAAAIACGDADIIPLECSCSKMIELANNMGIWQENDAYTPKPADIVLYDWQDSGIGDNKGTPDHVGMVESVANGIIIVIEGNKDKKVGKRSLLVNGKYIRGFILPKYQEKPVKVTAPTSPEDPGKTIWNYLIGKIGNQYGAAGLMGNLQAESGLSPKNVQNSYEKKLGMNDDQYVAAVDAGTYTNFVHDAAGFGLAQWTYYTRKQNLITFAKSQGRSIGDLQMQLDFLWQELQGSYKGVLNALKNAKSIREASDVVLTQFERPADQSEAVKIKRASYGQDLMNKYTGSGQSSSGSQEKKITKIAAAQSKDSKKAGTYTTTADLNLRYGPDSSKYASIKIMPKGTQVRCYGYYTGEWLYIADPSGQVGFAHSGYLKK